MNAISKPNTVQDPEDLTTLIERLLATRDKRLLTIVARSSAGSPVYHGVQLQHNFCRVTSPMGGFRGSIPTWTYLVVRGPECGIGPFVFRWPSDCVNPDQPACNGMCIKSITVHD